MSNDKLRIGIIGVRGRGITAVHWFGDGIDKRATVVAGADIKEENLSAFAKEVPNPVFTTTDYRKLLDRPDIDAIAVFTPDFCHEEHAIAALDAGKHVYCEKPLAITVEGCDRILDAEKRSGKKLMMGHNMRYMSLYQGMKQVIDSGDIGQVKAYWCRHFVGFGGHYYYHDWHATQKNCTSLLLQKGSHDLDMMHWLTGAHTVRVSAFGGLDWYGGQMPNDLHCKDCKLEDCPDRQFGNRGLSDRYDQCAFRSEVDIEDNQVLSMELEGGIKASYLQCHFTPQYHRNHCVIGTEGLVENLDDHGKIRVLMRPRTKKWKNLSDREYSVRQVEGSHGGADPQIAADFIRYILDNRKPLALPIDGRMAVAVGCAGAESMRSGGRPVSIKPYSS